MNSTSVKIVKDHLSCFPGDACLVEQNKNYYVVSSVMAPYSGFETLVFHANKNGEITDWEEVAGGRGLGRDEAIEQLEETNV